ncbi:MAG: hypothetical protein A3A80_00915 [Candidatus Terrybacteria bacterium RIFCSPLOWO2_01_FULL_44_24]|uniref:Peptidase C39-like domain-containing protein n=1 Tax=Candidatus Terrybacteria bacterium RIFCSPHIGHO2_01_FULL_43_35 TaxID=1802361 RepID=A0A1G2PFR9_9BACT|nr:MAG: hypothetical protein A2828_04210 [Candidatus Terrybacteria bacterium RIFCSPHIGHO2_01_FULL_43_35]OHA50703.1 MAG: hypothetical protein A3A80_00915 [Candidatus Terrybacteria bacterium RIFCSPLOWO2_01_FULL_44_24]
MYRTKLILVASLLLAACTAVSSPTPSLPSATTVPTPSATPAPSPSATTESPDLPPYLSQRIAPDPEPTASPTPEPTATPTPSVAPAPSVYKLNLYRKGAFVTQKTYKWCVGATTQMMINIIKGTNNKSYDTQKAMYDYAVAHTMYDYPYAGSDPQGSVAALEHFGGGDYRWVNSSSFSAAVRSAVRAIALTGRPVRLSVAHGTHAWVLNGFVTDKDPAQSKDFKVLYVYVSGPLYPMQQKNGYDMPPNTKLSVASLKKFLTPVGQDYKLVPYTKDGKTYYKKVYYDTVWTGYYVTIQPVP